MKAVIEMAREAGLLGPYDTEQDIVECGIEVWLSGELGMKAIEHFAELVRADAIADAVEREREACARIAEESSATTYECTVACGGPSQTFMQRMPKDAHEIAKEIRARGNK